MFKNHQNSPLNEFVPRSREERLALEIAKVLGDPDSLYHYIQICQKYPERLIRQILDEVLAVPACRIRKSRGALFTFLVKKRSHEIHT
jgi:hypothetical protein